LRQLLFALAFTLAACATLTARADPLPADPQLLRTCVTQAGEDRAVLARCNGVVARACIEAEGGPNAMSDVLCRSAEAGIWQALIDEETTRITAADPVDGELLASANQAWTQWRAAECNYRAYEYGGGAGEQYDRVVCDLDLASARAIDLIAN
jgi:uncharacterized protein YecT (DUF1311 family)